MAVRPNARAAWSKTPRSSLTRSRRSIDSSLPKVSIRNWVIDSFTLPCFSSPPGATCCNAPMKLGRIAVCSWKFAAERTAQNDRHVAAASS